MASPLENLSGPGRPLQKEAPDTKEFVGLRRSALDECYFAKSVPLQGLGTMSY